MCRNKHNKSHPQLRSNGALKARLPAPPAPKINRVSRQTFRHWHYIFQVPNKNRADGGKGRDSAPLLPNPRDSPIASLPKALAQPVHRSTFNRTSSTEAPRHRSAVAFHVTLLLDLPVQVRGVGCALDGRHFLCEGRGVHWRVGVLGLCLAVGLCLRGLGAVAAAGGGAGRDAAGLIASLVSGYWVDDMIELITYDE